MQAEMTPRHRSSVGRRLDRMRNRSRSVGIQNRAATGLIPPIRLGTSGQPIYVADAVVNALVLAVALGALAALWNALTE